MKNSRDEDEPVEPPCRVEDSNGVLLFSDPGLIECRHFARQYPYALNIFRGEVLLSHRGVAGQSNKPRKPRKCKKQESTDDA